MTVKKIRNVRIRNKKITREVKFSEMKKNNYGNVYNNALKKNNDIDGNFYNDYYNDATLISDIYEKDAKRYSYPLEVD